MKSEIKLKICDENRLSLGIFRWCGSTKLSPVVARDKLGDALSKIVEILNLCEVNENEF